MNFIFINLVWRQLLESGEDGKIDDIYQNNGDFSVLLLFIFFIFFNLKCIYFSQKIEILEFHGTIS